MAGISAIVSSTGDSILQLNGQDMQSSVSVQFSPSVSPNLLQKISTSPRFAAWISSYLPRPRQRLKLQSITFETVEVFDDETIGFIKLHADVVRSPEDTQVGGDVLLQGPSVAVLIVFRVNPEGSAPGSENASVYRPGDAPADAVQSGPRPREYVLFVKQARPAVGAPEHREIPSGHLGLDGLFTGNAFVAIHHTCGLRIYESQVEDLTSLALSVKRSPQRSLGISLSPASIDERVRLFLYRETVTRDFIETLQKHRSNGTAVLISIDLWTLNDAWRITSDAKTLSALFLFHELRYHQLMPRYRQPREVKKAPQFTSVADLNPNQSGLNLKVKVSETLKMIPHPTRDGIQKGIVVVGDATGVVSLSLDASQTSLVPGFSFPGSPLFLRNVEFDMSDGHITIVLDSFGKVSVPTDEELGQFSFTVNTKNNVSATEYEKVFQTEGVPNYPINSMGRNSRGRSSIRGRRTWNLPA